MHNMAVTEEAGSMSHSPTLSRPAGPVSRMAVIDLDDTLLGPDKHVSPENRNALRLLRSEGFQIVIASGRHHQNIMRLREEIGELTWVISAQGAVARNVVTGEFLHKLTMDDSLAAELYAA